MSQNKRLRIRRQAVASAYKKARDEVPGLFT